MNSSVPSTTYTEKHLTVNNNMANTEFTFSDSFSITSDVKKCFEERGYVIVRGLLDSDEVAQLKRAVNDTDAITKHAQGISDGEGRQSRLAIWRHPGHDVTGMLARCEKVAGFSEKLLGGEVYHYSSKLMMKEPETGGKHLWHQDYGYFYKNGILFPDLLSVFIPIDKCVRENGCLEILEGSHHCGRIEHPMVAGQTAADMERVNHIRKKCPHIYVEMEPGDALFFHSNLLHSSGINNSTMRRWVFISCFNMASNNPVYKHEYPQYIKLHKVPNTALKECTNITDMGGKDFVDLRNDKTVRVEDKGN